MEKYGIPACLSFLREAALLRGRYVVLLLAVVVVYSDSRPRAMTEIMHDTIRDRPEGPLATLSINA